jgi:hypothetical protein
MHPALAELEEVEQFTVTIGTNSTRIPRLALRCSDQSITGIRNDSTTDNFDTTACDPETVARQLAEFCLPAKNEDVIITASPRSYLATRSAAVLAVFVASNWPRLRSGSTFLDVVVAHAIPVAASAELRTQAYRMIDELVSAQQLLLLARSEAITVDPSKCSARIIELRHRRTLRRNSDLIAERGRDANALLARWSDHSDARFGYRLPPDVHNALSRFWSTRGVEVIEYRDASGYLGSSLIYIDGESRTLFDILAPWSVTGKLRRLGIFMGVQNLLRAQELGFRYSLCYGEFQYKLEIIAGLPRVDL